MNRNELIAAIKESSYWKESFSYGCAKVKTRPNEKLDLILSPNTFWIWGKIDTFGVIWGFCATQYYGDLPKRNAYKVYDSNTMYNWLEQLELCE